MSEPARGALLLLVLAAGSCSAEPVATTTATDTHGVVARIEALRGKPVLVNFWATWCAPCLAELPDLVAGTHTFREQGGVVLTVALEQMGADIDAAEAVRRADAKARELGLDLPVLVDTDDDMNVIRDVLGVELGGLPQTLTYDRNGRLVAQHEGIASAAQFAELAAAAAR